MLDPSMLHETIELIAENFNADEIDHIGSLVFRSYNSHKVSGTPPHITLSARKCADTLARHCNKEDKEMQLVKLLIELDDSVVKRRPVNIDGLENYLHKLAKTGVEYDFRKRKLSYSRKDLKEQVNWGALKDGKIYALTVLSLDIVGNSKLVKRFGTRKMEKVYYQLRLFLKQKLDDYDGRVWNFAGDGGVFAFAFPGQETRAVLFALDIQSTLPLFNIKDEVTISEPIALRIALDCGKVNFFSNTGQIVSDVINYASHLEKTGTEAGSVSISGRIYGVLNPKMQRIFISGGSFEGEEFFSTPRRIDQLYRLTESPD